MYQINGEDKILAWMADQPTELVQAVMDWLPALAEAPEEMSTAVRTQTHGPPAYVARVLDTPVFVSFVVIDQYKTVLIHSIATVNIKDLPDFPADDS